MLVNQHEFNKKPYSIRSYAGKLTLELNLNGIEKRNNETVTEHAKRVKQNAKAQALDSIKREWECKARHR